MVTELNIQVSIVYEFLVSDWVRVFYIPSNLKDIFSRNLYKLHFPYRYAYNTFFLTLKRLSM